MQVLLPDIICDTSFLMHMATDRIYNRDSIQIDLGNINYVVPYMVVAELENLLKNSAKHHYAKKALLLAKDMKRIKLEGRYTDEAITNHILDNKGFVATMDKNLKKSIRKAGGYTISIHHDHIVLD